VSTGNLLDALFLLGRQPPPKVSQLGVAPLVLPAEVRKREAGFIVLILVDVLRVGLALGILRGDLGIVGEVETARGGGIDLELVTDAVSAIVCTEDAEWVIFHRVVACGGSLTTFLKRVTKSACRGEA